MLGKPADLTHFNTLGLACQADKVVVLHSLEQLEAMAVELAQTPGLLLLGGGSNVILPSQISHLVMRVNLKGIELVEERAHHWVIDVAAGENWHPAPFVLLPCFPDGRRRGRRLNRAGGDRLR